MIVRLGRASLSSARIVIHVGAPKTGTTYIQKSLQDDTRYCRKSGVYVPEDPRIKGVAGNAKVLSLACRNRSHVSFSKRFPNLDLARIDPADAFKVLTEKWKPQKETLLLSAEHFHANDAPVMREIIGREVDVSIVLFIRRQDRWLQSWHNQLTKSAGTTASLDDFIQKIGNEEDELLGSADWLKTYQTWLDAFGDTRVCIFDEVRSDLLGAFLAASELPSLPKLKKQSPKQVSLNSYELAYLLEIRPDVSYEDFLLHRQACLMASQSMSGLDKVSFLSPATRHYLVERYNPLNAELMGLLGRPDASHLVQIPESDPSYVDLAAFRNRALYREYTARVAEVYRNEVGVRSV